MNPRNLITIAITSLFPCYLIALADPQPSIPPDSNGTPAFLDRIVWDTPPQIIPDHSPQPAYPASARGSGLKGRVSVQVHISEKGEIKEWRIVNAEPDSMGFAEEVVKVLPNWKITPAMRDGVPVAGWFVMPFTISPPAAKQDNQVTP